MYDDHRATEVVRAEAQTKREAPATAPSQLL